MNYEEVKALDLKPGDLLEMDTAYGTVRCVATSPPGEWYVNVKPVGMADSGVNSFGIDIINSITKIKPKLVVQRGDILRCNMYVGDEVLVAIIGANEDEISYLYPFSTAGGCHVVTRERLTAMYPNAELLVRNGKAVTNGNK